MLGNLGSWHSYECYFYKYHPPKNTTADQVPPLMATALPSSRCTQGVDLTSKFPRSHHIRQLVLMSWPIGVQSGIRSVMKERFTFLLQFVCIGSFQSMSTLTDMMHMVGSASPPLMMSVSSLFISSKQTVIILMHVCLSTSLVVGSAVG